MWSSWLVLTIIFWLLKGVVVFLQKCIPALFYCFHGHVPTHPGHLSLKSFSAEPLSRDCLCSVHRKPIPSSCSSCEQFVWTPVICVWTQDAKSLGGCVHVGVINILPWLTLTPRSPDPQFSSKLLASCSVPYSRLKVTLVWTGGGLTGSSPHCFKAGPSSQYQFRHVPSLHSVQSCVHSSASTSWESTSVSYLL